MRNSAITSRQKTTSRYSNLLIFQSSGTSIRARKKDPKKRKSGVAIDDAMRAIEKENKRLKDILGRTYEYCLSMFAEQEGQRGLGDMKLPGCSGHVFLSRHSKEISEGTDLHIAAPMICQFRISRYSL